MKPALLTRANATTAEHHVPVEQRLQLWQTPQDVFQEPCWKVEVLLVIRRCWSHPFCWSLSLTLVAQPKRTWQQRRARGLPQEG